MTKHTIQHWLHFTGNYLEFDNTMHLWTDCDKTTEGLLCGATFCTWETYLLEHCIKHCEWTVIPKSYNVFFLISPQLVCIVTDNLSTTSVYQLGSPLSRCLTHIDHLYWERTAYYFLPMKTRVLWTQMLFPYVVCF